MPNFFISPRNFTLRGNKKAGRGKILKQGAIAKKEVVNPCLTLLMNNKLKLLKRIIKFPYKLRGKKNNIWKKINETISTPKGNSKEKT